MLDLIQLILPMWVGIWQSSLLPCSSFGPLSRPSSLFLCLFLPLPDLLRNRSSHNGERSWCCWRFRWLLGLRITQQRAIWQVSLNLQSSDTDRRVVLGNSTNASSLLLYFKAFGLISKDFGVSIAAVANSIGISVSSVSLCHLDEWRRRNWWSLPTVSFQSLLLSFFHSSQSPIHVAISQLTDSGIGSRMSSLESIGKRVR